MLMLVLVVWVSGGGCWCFSLRNAAGASALGVAVLYY